MMYYQAVAESEHVSLDTPVKDLPDHAMKSFLYGTTKELFLHRIQENGKSTGYRAAFEGVIPNLERRAREGSEWAKAEISAYMSAVPCPVCHGKRLKKEVLGVTVGGLNIMELTDLSITESLQFFETLSDGAGTEDCHADFERNQGTAGFPEKCRAGIPDTLPNSRHAFRRRKSTDSSGNADWLIFDGRSVYFG